MKWLDRIMGRSVVDLAKEVDDAKALLDTAQGRLAEQLGKVAQEEQNVALAQQDYDAACAALVEEHPHLIGKMKTLVKEALVDTTPEYPTHDEIIANPGAWDPEPIEVDDEFDPRYATGVSPVDPSDSSPLPPVEFGERVGEVEE